MDHDGFQGGADEYGSLDFACLDLLGDGGGGDQSQNDLSAPPTSQSGGDDGSYNYGTAEEFVFDDQQQNQEQYEDVQAPPPQQNRGPPPRQGNRAPPPPQNDPEPFGGGGGSMSLGQQFLDLCSSLQDDSGGLDEFAQSAPAPKAPPPQKQYVRDDPPMNQNRGPPPPRRQQPFVSRTSVRQPSQHGRFRPQGRPGGMVRPVGPGSSGIRPVRPRGQIVTSVRVNAPRRIGGPGDKPNVKQVRVAPGSGPGSLRNRPMRHGAPQQSPVHQRRQPPPPQQHRMDDGVIDLDQDHPRDDYYQDNRSYGNNQRQRDDMGGMRRSSDQFDRGGIKRPSSISPKPDSRNMGYSQNNSNYQSGYNEGYQNKQPVRKPVNQGPGPPPGRIRPGAPNRGPPNSNQPNRNPNYRQGPPQSQMGQRRPPPPSQSLEQPERGNQNQRSPNMANQRHPSGNRVPQIQKPQQQQQQQSQNDQDFGQFGDYNNKSDRAYSNNRAAPAPTPPTQNNQKFRQQQPEPQLSPPKPNDSTDISAIMDDILSPPQKSVHQTQQPTQKQPPMSRNPSAGQQPANKRPGMGRDQSDMNNLVPPMNNNQNQQSIFEQKDRMNRMTPSPAAPSPGQQPTPPPTQPGQQKQKPSMPSWFSGSGSFGKSSSANQPMTPSPSQPSPGTPSVDPLQNAPQLSGIKNEPAPFSPDVSKQKPVTTSVLSSSLSSTFPASSAPVPTQPQQNSVFSSSLFNQEWPLSQVSQPSVLPGMPSTTRPSVVSQTPRVPAPTPPKPSQPTSTAPPPFSPFTSFPSTTTTTTTTTPSMSSMTSAPLGGKSSTTPTPSVLSSSLFSSTPSATPQPSSLLSSNTPSLMSSYPMKSDIFSKSTPSAAAPTTSSLLTTPKSTPSATPKIFDDLKANSFLSKPTPEPPKVTKAPPVSKPSAPTISSLGSNLLPKASVPGTTPASNLSSTLGSFDMMQNMHNLPAHMLQDLITQMSSGVVPMAGMPGWPGLPNQPVQPQPVVKQTVVPSKASDLHSYPKDLIVNSSKGLLDQSKITDLTSKLTTPPAPKPTPPKTTPKVDQNDDVSLSELVKKKITPDREKKSEPSKHFNPKKAILSQINTGTKEPTNPLLNKILKESPINKTTTTPVTPKSHISRVLPTEDKPKAPLTPSVISKPKEKEKKKKRKRERPKKTEKPSEPPLPPDPGYIPKVRITTFRSLNGAAIHQSNQFKPGEERKKRSSRRRENYETKKVDLAEINDWVKSHVRRKTDRRHRRLGLPSDEDSQAQLANNNHMQDIKNLDDELKRRQEALERENVRLEDEPADIQKDENHDFSMLIDAKPPVPRYHPAQPPKRLFLDEMLNSTKRCLECGDEFMFESSLDQHYNRKSIVIEINCMICKGKMLFYNKCQLLRHAREHTQNNEPMKFASPTIEPLSVKLCQPKTKSPDLNTQFAKSCTECNAQFATRIGLQEHMQRQVEPMTCEPCGMTLPNRCSYMAHTRIHTDSSPLVCPDCGENFNNDRSEFMKHIKLHCFHTSRILGYRCPESGKVFSRIEFLVSHIHNNLLTRFFKCAECPIAFRSQSKIMFHTKEEHPKTAMLYRPIFKCPLCTDLFHDKEQEAIPRHILSHVKNSTATCFHCLVCPEVYETKAELAEHLSNEHNISEHKTTAEELQAALSAQRSMKKGVFPRNISSESANSQTVNGDHLDDFDSDDSSFSDPETKRRRKTKKPGQHPKFRFKDGEKRKPSDKALNGKKDGAKVRINVCRYCSYSSAKSLAKHFSKVHNIDHMTPDMIKTKIIQGDEMPDPANLPTTGRPVLVTPTGPISMRNMRKEPTQEELAKEDPPLPEFYHCQKCEFKARSQDREIFQKHIKKHFDSKVDGFQCTECGNCFCSLSALEKHLYMTHKVRSILQLDRIDAKFRAPIAPTKKETEHSFRCQTCQKTFASEEVLKQHAKSHGLDYIKGLK